MFLAIFCDTCLNNQVHVVSGMMIYDGESDLILEVVT